MKKFILSAVAILLVGGACCVNAQELTKEQKAEQKAQLKELKGFLKEAKKNSQIGEGMKPDFAAARAAIANAAKNPQAPGNLEFLMQAAEVESNAFNAATQAQDYPALGAAAAAGFEYYKQAYVAAGDNKSAKTKIQAGALNIYQVTNGLSLLGNIFYQEGQNAENEEAKRAGFQKCLDSWQIAKTAHLEPVIADNILAQPIVEINAADSILSGLYLNCFTVAQYMLNDTVAANKELLYLKDHPADDNQLNQVLQALCLNYYGQEDNAHFEQSLKEGVERLPQETWYINNLINVYINDKKYEEASNFIDKALEKDPNSAMLLNVKGSLLEQLEKMDDAFVCYKKAYDLDPTDYSVNSNLGRYYYNQAQNVEEQYYSKKQFDQGDKAAQEYYDKALPYYEAAYAFDSERKDKGIAVALRMLYGKQIAKGNKALKAKRDQVSLDYGFDL